MPGYLRSLNPQLPRSVQILQLGGLANAFGNGIVLPFTFIYLHNVRGMGLGTAGLVLATNAGVSLVAGPLSGIFVDRVGGKRTLAAALSLLTLGYGGYAFVHQPWQGFATAAVTGIGNGAFWPAQSTLIAALVPPERRTPAFAMQRVVMNLGIGLGAMVGGLVASASHPRSFEILFLLDGLTFVVYMAVLAVLVPEPGHHRRASEAPAGGYVAVLRNRPFVAVIAINTVFIFAGFAGLDLLPVYAKNHAGVGERAIGFVFLLNTLVIVALQLPIARLVEGHRRMRLLGLLGLVWALAWLLVPIGGVWLTGLAATAIFAVAGSVFGLGECLHGSVQAPLVVDLAEPALLGRYMALSALSWQIGFTLGPAVGGYVLAATPHGTWLAAGAICAVNGALAVAAERRLPVQARRAPLAAAA
jgi:predicted MFS family arabinose efflux permease